MTRRDLIALLGGAVASWPVGVRAQQPERVRRIGVLQGLAANDPEGQARFEAFLQTLQQLGWTDGRKAVAARPRGAGSLWAPGAGGTRPGWRGGKLK
jgi:hypothetical protein